MNTDIKQLLDIAAARQNIMGLHLKAEQQGFDKEVRQAIRIAVNALYKAEQIAEAECVQSTPLVLDSLNELTAGRLMA